MKRLKKKDKETESKNPTNASVSKLICTTKGQNQTLNGTSKRRVLCE